MGGGREGGRKWKDALLIYVIEKGSI